MARAIQTWEYMEMYISTRTPWAQSFTLMVIHGQGNTDMGIYGNVHLNKITMGPILLS